MTDGVCSVDVAALKRRMVDPDGRYEVRYATLDDGKTVLDEVVAKGASVHLESMSESCWLLILEWPDGTRLDTTLYAKRAHVHGRAELDSGRRPSSDRDPIDVLASALAIHCGDPSSEERYQQHGLGGLVAIAAARLVDSVSASCAAECAEMRRQLDGLAMRAGQLEVERDAAIAKVQELRRTLNATSVPRPSARRDGGG